jgi:hypothetical protein
MKILESYKKIAKSMLIEHAWDRKFGESLPTLEDVMNEADVMSHVIKYKDEDGNEKEISVKSALQAGESHPAYKQASDIADKGQAGLAQKDKEEPKAKGFEPDDFERDFDDSEPDDDPTRTDDDPDSEFGKDYMSKFIGTDEPDSFDARKILAKMSRKELAKTKWPFDPEDEDNYLGSPDYDPEDDSFKPPNLDGLEDMDYTTLKQKYMDLLAHKAQMEYDIEDADSQDDPDWEKESQEKRSTAVKNQNRILKLLTPQKQTVGMGGRSTRGGIGIRDSVEINGKKYKKVKEEKKATEKHILRENYERFGGK